MSTLRMEAAEPGVIYNTLINQTREFTIVTSDSNDDITVQIRKPNTRNLENIPVQDCGNGRYTFSYRPSSTENYQVTVKVNGVDIQGSPFPWEVEQWHLVGWDGRSMELRLCQENMTVCRTGTGDSGDVVGSCGFPAGRHSWKVKLISGGMSVGVTDCDGSSANQELDREWYWCHGSRNFEATGVKYREQPSNIPEFSAGDVCVMFLDHHNKQVTIHHLRSRQTDTLGNLIGHNETIFSHYFCPARDSQMTLLF